MMMMAGRACERLGALARLEEEELYGAVGGQEAQEAAYFDGVLGGP